ncbi:hypothetical protein LCGC14_2727840, partial [marine sediment metagenome]
MVISVSGGCGIGVERFSEKYFSN